MDDPKKRPPMDHGTTFWGEEGWISVSRGALYGSPKSLQTTHIRDDEKVPISMLPEQKKHPRSRSLRAQPGWVLNQDPCAL